MIDTRDAVDRRPAAGRRRDRRLREAGSRRAGEAGPMKLAIAEGRRPRRHADRGQPRSHARASRAGASRRPCSRRSTTGPTAAPKLARRAAQLLRGQGRRGCFALRPARRCAAPCRAPISGPTARPMSSCRAGAQGARRGDAAELLDRSADVPGRLRLLHRARTTPIERRRRGLGHRFRGRGRRHRRRRADGRLAAQAARTHIKLVMLVNDVSLRNLIPASWPRASASSSASPPRPSRRSR